MSGLQGARLGDYELIERIGEGGMAEVYRAKQCTAFGREVALKVIRPEFTGDEPFRRRFLREAHVIARLSHPHILPLIEFGDEQGTLYLVMPLVREGTLRDLLKDHAGPLSLEEALPLFVPLCDAVEYAHQEDVIHRDIKPQNILLQRHTHVLLADFGIAHDRFDTKMTTTGVGIGSVEYMAPEQAEGRADARSDLYSLGVVLYQLLTGAVPYSGSLPLQVLFKKANDPLPDPRRHNPNLPAEVIDLLNIALARDPLERFASAAALGRAAQQLKPQGSSPPLWGQMPWLNAPAPEDVDAISTLRIRPNPPTWDQPTSSSRRLASAPTMPVPAESALTQRHTNRPSLRSQGEPESWAAAGAPYDERWPDDWDNRRNFAPPAASRPAQRSSLLPVLLIVSLVLVVLLTLGVSSVASGYLNLDWLHGNSTNTGAQLVTPTPDTGQSSQFPAPVNTAPAWPPVNNPQPTSTDTPQPTSTTTPQPSPTTTPVATDTPTPQPTAPAPTDTPAPQPTLPPPPAPTQAPAIPPGNATNPGTQATPTP